jgi:hypothetical protein
MGMSAYDIDCKINGKPWKGTIMGTKIVNMFKDGTEGEMQMNGIGPGLTVS